MKTNRSDDQHLLDYVLETLEKRGVGLSYRPELLYLERSLGDMVALVNGGLDNTCLQETLATVWRVKVPYTFARHGLQVSDSAIERYVDTFTAGLADFVRLHNSNPIVLVNEQEIGLLTSFERMPADMREASLAHEVWHLIEKERGVFMTQHEIVEGTANYVGARFYGGPFFVKRPALCGNAQELSYLGATSVVFRRLQEVKGQYGSYYHAMLDPAWRDITQARFVEESADVLDSLWAKSSGVERELVHECAAHLGTPVPRQITADILLNEYSKLGGTAMADELRTQDLTSFVQARQLLLDEFWKNQR